MHRVLLVEDDSLLRRALRRALVHCGFQVDDAPGAVEALTPLHTQSFACVVTDFHLPGHDGLWLLAEARKSQPDAVRILCSGFEVDARHLESGLVDRVLLKPFEIDDLLSLLPPA